MEASHCRRQLAIITNSDYFHVDKGCTTYFTDSARNISGREVGGRSGGLRLCPQWGPWA